jgi:hypothetical protein
MMRPVRILFLTLPLALVGCSSLKDSHGHKLSHVERTALKTCDQAFHNVAESPFDPVWSTETVFTRLENEDQLLRWPQEGKDRHACVTSPDGTHYVGGLVKAVLNED